MIMPSTSIALLISILLLFTPNKSHSCNEKERIALLDFKHGLSGTSNRLSSWSSENGDCCQWAGVECDSVTGHVIVLNLRAPNSSVLLSGEIRPSLLDLKFLSYLDMSLNYFSIYQIPTFLGSLQSLRHLDLSRSGFVGLIPHELGNLTNLEYLNLAYNYNLLADNLTWIPNLSSLRYLDLSKVDLQNIEWLHVVSRLPSISELRLESCQIQEIIPPKIDGNISSLQVLDLSMNNIDSQLPPWISNTSAGLVQLNLGSNFLQGELPHFLFSFQSLRYLDLQDNQLSGSIPESIGQLKLLESLDLSMNNISGEIPQSLSDLSFLSNLDLAYNNLSGRIPTSTQLQSFDARSYEGNPELCGTPLTKNCTEKRELPKNSQVKGDDTDSSDSGASEYYMAVGFGFAAGLLGFCCLLYFNKTLTRAYFRAIENLMDKVYVTYVLSIRRMNAMFRN